MASTEKIESDISILVVEDEKDIRENIVLTLKKAGYQVDQASDGLVGLEIMNLNPQKEYLLITDLKMPRLDGDRMVAEALRQGMKFFSIVVTSGELYGGEGIVRLVSIGAKFLQKPYTTQEVLELVQTIETE